MCSTFYVDVKMKYSKIKGWNNTLLSSKTDATVSNKYGNDMYSFIYLMDHLQNSLILSKSK